MTVSSDRNRLFVVKYNGLWKTIQKITKMNQKKQTKE